MSTDPGARRAELRRYVGELAGELREWLEWAESSGAHSVPPPSPELIEARPPRAQAVRPVPVAHHASPAPAPAGRRGEPRARPDTLEDIRRELGDCTRCELSRERRHIVFGVGNPRADLVVVGEAPGRDEDLTGEPFVGRAGGLLNRMLAAIGLSRREVYICNVIKCRPPSNRNPQDEEILACHPFLERQLGAIAPRAILAMGRFACQTLLGTGDSIGRLRLELRSLRGIPLVATYHPAYLLRRPSEKRKSWEDLQKVRQVLSG